MALIQDFHPMDVEGQRVHGPIDCYYRTFMREGETYLHLRTYRQGEGEPAGSGSQHIQLDRQAANQLIRILVDAFIPAEGH